MHGGGDFRPARKVFCTIYLLTRGHAAVLGDEALGDIFGTELRSSGLDAPPNSATGSVPTVVTTGIHHQPPPAPPSLFTAGAVLAPSTFHKF